MGQIKKGAIISYAAIFLNIAAGLIYTPWMVRQLGVSDYGLYALVGAFLSYFLMDFGLGAAISRFIALARAKGDENEVAKLVSTTTRIYLFIDLIIAVALIIAFFFISGIFTNFTAEELEKFKVIYCIAGLFSLLSFPLMPQDGILIAYERFVVLKSAKMVQKLGVILLMVIALYLGLGLYALILINGLVGFAIALYKFWYIRRNTAVKVSISIFDSALAKSLFKFSVWIFIIGIAQRLLLNIAPAVLGRYSGTTQIAIFAIGMSLEAYTYTFATALNGLFMPKVAKLSIKTQSRTEINNLMVMVGRLQLLIVGLIITGLIVLGKSFIQLWMGHDFDNSYIVALCLIIPGIISLTQEIANSLLVVENEVRYRAILFLSASAVSVVIGAILAPTMGAVGVAIGILTALIICHIVGMNIVYSLKLKLDIIGFFKNCHLKMLPAMLLSALVSISIQYFIPIDSWVLFILHGSVFAIIYYMFMWLFALNSNEKTLVTGVFGSIKKKFK